MTAGFPEAAERLRLQTSSLAVIGLQSALEAAPEMRDRLDDTALRAFLLDAETFVTRLAMCVGSDDPRWLVEFGEWVTPVFRRRRISLRDVAALCKGIGRAAAGVLEGDALASSDRAIAAVSEVLDRNSRLAGDTHKRNALWNWMYRGV